MGKPSIDFSYTPEYEPCAVATAAAAHSDEMVTKLAEVVDQILDHRRKHGTRSNRGPNARWLQGKLAEHGIDVSHQQTGKHVNGTCSCQRIVS